MPYYGRPLMLSSLQIVMLSTIHQWFASTKSSLSSQLTKRAKRNGPSNCWIKNHLAVNQPGACVDSRVHDVPQTAPVCLEHNHPPEFIVDHPVVNRTNSTHPTPRLDTGSPKLDPPFTVCQNVAVEYRTNVGASSVHKNRARQGLLSKVFTRICRCCCCCCACCPRKQRSRWCTTRTHNPVPSTPQPSPSRPSPPADNLHNMANRWQVKSMETICSAANDAPVTHQPDPLQQLSLDSCDKAIESSVAWPSSSEHHSSMPLPTASNAAGRGNPSRFLSKCHQIAPLDSSALNISNKGARKGTVTGHKGAPPNGANSTHVPVSTKRLMKELGDLMRKQTIHPQSSAFTVELVDDSLYEWHIKIHQFDADSQVRGCVGNGNMSISSSQSRCSMFVLRNQSSCALTCTVHSLVQAR